MKAYLANGLFSEADRLYNEYVEFLVKMSFPNLNLYLPQNNEEINDKSNFADSKAIADGDDNYLKESDFVIAIIDNVDEGVACEVGVATTLGKPVFALYTDIRQFGTGNERKIDILKQDPTENQFIYKNLYLIGKIKNSGGGVYSNIEDLIDGIAKAMNT